jgi:hypothetical protein
MASCLKIPSRSMSYQPSGRKSSQDRRSLSPAVAPRDIFQPSRDTFQKEHERGKNGRETSSAPARVMVHTAQSHQSSSSPPVRDFFQPPRDIFQKDNVRNTNGRAAIPDPVRVMGQQASHLQSSPSARPQAARQAPNHQSSPSSFRHQPVSSNTNDSSWEMMITYYGVRKGHRVGVCDSWEEL